MEKDTLYMHEVANGYRPDVERLIQIYHGWSQRLGTAYPICTRETESRNIPYLFQYMMEL